MKQKIIIAIDGYSSCGKSTLAKQLSKELKYIYADSGAMYRAITLYFLRNSISLTDKAQIRQALKNIYLEFIFDFSEFFDLTFFLSLFVKELNQLFKNVFYYDESNKIKFQLLVAKII